MRLSTVGIPHCAKSIPVAARGISVSKRFNLRPGCSTGPRRFNSVERDALDLSCGRRGDSGADFFQKHGNAHFRNAVFDFGDERRKISIAFRLNRFLKRIEVKIEGIAAGFVDELAEVARYDAVIELDGSDVPEKKGGLARDHGPRTT